MTLTGLGFDPDRLARVDAVFRRYVDDGRLPGWQVLVTRGDEVAHASEYGQRDLEAGLPVTPDTLWRIYSMTKPVTAVAAMSLVEEGAFSLNDPLADYLPAFARPRLLTGGTAEHPETEPSPSPIRIWHLFTHTAGLTYGFTRSSLLDDIYRLAGSDFLQPPGLDLADLCDLWAGLPLLFEPGTAWNYSVATDVLGRVLEVVTGQTLDRVFAERVFQPLGMTDTGFWAPEREAHRLAALYVPDASTGRAVRHEVLSRSGHARPSFLGGGGGLVASASDYARFTAMLAGQGATGGQRILAPATVELMTANHLPGGALLPELARGQFAEADYAGRGFGLGLSVLVDPAAAHLPGSHGEFSWGGAASTVFFVDPLRELTAAFYTQLLPSNTYPLRGQLRQLVYAALVDG